MSKFIITEPAPSSSSYVRSGRGGFGNTFPISSLPSPSASTTASSHPQPSSTRRFFSGIGGFGNAHAANERPPVSLDQEFKARSRANKPSGHCGIGGAGNVYVRKGSDASIESLDDDDASARSSMSEKAKLWARVRGSFEKS